MKIGSATNARPLWGSDYGGSSKVFTAPTLFVGNLIAPRIRPLVAFSAW